jgi:predicted nucleotidyltransferase
MDALRQPLELYPRIAYAVLFGSRLRGDVRAGSDLDIAIGLEPGAHLTLQELGELAADIERETGQHVDLVLLDEAPPGLAYRVFRDGSVVFVRDRRALVARKAKAILEYLDFQPVEELCVRGVLAAAARGR